MSFNDDHLVGFDEAASEVNSWAEKETNGLITQVLPPESIDTRTRLILANALYFKAAETQHHQFHLLDGSSVHSCFHCHTHN